MKMCQAMAVNGNEVDLLVPDDPGIEPGVSDVFAYYDVAPCFGFRKLTFPAIPGQTSILSAAALLYLARHRPSLLYTRSLQLALRMNAFLRVPFVLELHAPVKRPFQNRFRRMIARSYFRRLVVISQKLKDMFVEDFPELANRILVAHDGADDPRPDRHIAPSAGGFHVGYVGHLYPGRGTDLMRDLAASLPAMTLHVVGGAEDDRARFVASGLPGNVVVHGYKRPGVLPAFFARFDACIAPYERKVTLTGGAGDTSAFMSPLKIFEYMSWAKPIVASDLPVLREVLRDGENSILVPPDDKQAWVAAIERLMADVALRTRIAEGARADFLGHYSWTQRASTVLQGI